MVQNGGSELTEVKMTSEGGGVFQSVLKKNQVYTIFCTRPTTCEFWSNMRSVRADLSRQMKKTTNQHAGIPHIGKSGTPYSIIIFLFFARKHTGRQRQRWA
jgi:hypothetical protein